jgi:hypothetical protein
MFNCPECDAEINTASDVCPYCGAASAGGSAAASANSTEGAKTRKTTLRQLMIYAAVLAWTWGLLWLAFPMHQANRTSNTEGQARKSIEQVQAVLASYAGAQGHYPESLESVGGAARAAVQSAQTAGYQLQYAPGVASADGRVHGYTLTARSGYYGFRNFYTDETGILRATQENRAATPQDAPY